MLMSTDNDNSNKICCQSTRKEVCQQDRKLVDNNCSTPTKHHGEKATVSSSFLSQQQKPRTLLLCCKEAFQFPGWGSVREGSAGGEDFHFQE